MFEDTAEVVKRCFGEVCILTLFVEEVFTVFPDRLVNVHTVTVVIVDRLRHECRSFTVKVCNHFYDIFVLLYVVCSSDDVPEDNTDFTLSLCHFVVSENNFKAYLFKKEHHFRSEVYHRVSRHDREVTTFDSWSVTHVSDIVILSSICPVTFICFYFERLVVVVVVDLHIIKDEELIFRTEVCSITDTLLFKVLKCFFRDRSWTFCIQLIFIDVVNITDDNNSRISGEWIHKCCRDVRLEQHVRLVDRLPVFDGRPVEWKTRFEHLVTDCTHSV